MEYKTDSPVTVDMNTVLKELQEAGCYEDNMGKDEAVQIWKTIRNSLVKSQQDDEYRMILKQTELNISQTEDLRNIQSQEEEHKKTPVRKMKSPVNQKDFRIKSELTTKSVNCSQEISEELADFTQPYLDPKYKHLPLEERVKLTMEYHMRLVTNYGRHVRKQLHFAPWPAPVHSNPAFNGNLYRNTHPLYEAPSLPNESSMQVEEEDKPAENNSDSDTDTAMQTKQPSDDEFHVVSPKLTYAKRNRTKGTPKSGESPNDLEIETRSKKNEQLSIADTKEKLEESKRKPAAENGESQSSPAAGRFRIPKKSKNEEIMARSRFFADTPKTKRSLTMMELAAEIERKNAENEKSAQNFMNSLQETDILEESFDDIVLKTDEREDEEPVKDHQLVDADVYRRIVPPVPKGSWVSKQTVPKQGKRKLTNTEAAEKKVADKAKNTGNKRKRKGKAAEDDYTIEDVVDVEDADDFCSKPSTSSSQKKITERFQKCPLCNENFSMDIIENHAGRCGINEGDQVSAI